VTRHFLSKNGVRSIHAERAPVKIILGLANKLFLRDNAPTAMNFSRGKCVVLHDFARFEGKVDSMQQATFKIRRKIIVAFLFCLLSTFLFALLSFQVHRDIGRRLRLVEVADDLINNILELRRFEKNFFLYKERSSLQEALSYASRVEELYLRNRSHIVLLKKEGAGRSFSEMLRRYKESLSELQAGLQEKPAAGRGASISTQEESLRKIGQELLNTATTWAKEERSRIDTLFRQAMYLFVVSMLLFVVLGIAVAAYLSRLLTRPLVQMQQAMEKIALGDFTPIPEGPTHSEEFLPLFRAFNRMIHELEERQEQLVHARKISAIGTFTSGIAHELNNPVNNIVLTAEALKEEYDELDREEALGMIQDILVQSDRASEIIRNLLDFSRSERPEMVSVSVRDVIGDTLRLVRNQLLLSGVDEVTEIPESLPSVCGDYKSLQQVFLNLFINAVQAMPQGGRITTRAGLSDDGDYVKVEVADNGGGIANENLPHIFDPFFTTKEVGKGTGLGLSVTYGILQKHRGRIDIQSHEGAGTTVTVLLPVEKDLCLMD
jgi:two-component system NtrC family sensor kinase